MAKAEERLMAMQPKAFSTIDKLMDRDEFPTVQLQASARVIEWTHGKAVERQEVNVTGQLDLVLVLKQRQARRLELAESFAEMGPAHGPETDAGAR